MVLEFEFPIKLSIISLCAGLRVEYHAGQESSPRTFKVMVKSFAPFYL